MLALLIFNFFVCSFDLSSAALIVSDKLKANYPTWSSLGGIGDDNTFASSSGPVGSSFALSTKSTAV